MRKRRVNGHDFEDEELGEAVPRGCTRAHCSLAWQPNQHLSACSHVRCSRAAFTGTGLVQCAKTSARTAASRTDVRMPPWQATATVGTAELAAKAATEFTLIAAIGRADPARPLAKALIAVASETAQFEVPSLAVAVIAVATGSKAWPPIVAVAANPTETRWVKLPPPPKPITIAVAATTLRVPWPAIVIVVAARAPNPNLRGPKSASRPGPSGPKPRGPRPKLEIQLVPLGESGNAVQPFNPSNQASARGAGSSRIPRTHSARNTCRASIGCSIAFNDAPARPDGADDVLHVPDACCGPAGRSR
jgi:hypothetical protein